MSKGHVFTHHPKKVTFAELSGSKYVFLGGGFDFFLDIHPQPWERFPF